MGELHLGDKNAALVFEGGNEECSGARSGTLAGKQQRLVLHSVAGCVFVACGAMLVMGG